MTSGLNVVLDFVFIFTIFKIGRENFGELVQKVEHFFLSSLDWWRLGLAWTIGLD